MSDGTAARRIGLLIALAAGCGDPLCSNMVGPSAIVSRADLYQVDVYGPGVACDGARGAPGSGPPQLVRTFEGGAPLTFEVTSGDHTIVLSAFSALEPIGSACYRGSFGAAARICISVTLQPELDLSVCSSAGCACLSDTDCEAGLYCSADQRCRAGCRDNEDCLARAQSDGGQTVLLPLCDPGRRECVACTRNGDCVRAPSCQANVRIVYPPEGGVCAAGACQFPAPVVESCPFGCYQGACATKLAAIPAVRALQAGTQTQVVLAEVIGAGTGGGNAAAARDVTVRVETRPRGAAKTVRLGVFYNGDFANQQLVPMTLQGEAGTDRDLFAGTIPKRPAGTRVYFFVDASGWDGTTVYAPGNNKNYQYGSN